jgi:putative Mn2+ efflux pump MntP
MSFRIVAFVFPLALDTLALSIALGLRGFRPWRPAVVFAIFEGVMPLFGIGLARMVSPRFETAAVLIGSLVLIAVGIHAIREAVRAAEEAEKVSFGSLRSMLLAGLAISTDELAAGFPMGTSGLPIGIVLGTIVVQTLLATVIGVTVGNRVRSGLAMSASRFAGIAAGVVFILVGVWLTAERLAH